MQAVKAAEANAMALNSIMQSCICRCMHQALEEGGGTLAASRSAVFFFSRAKISFMSSFAADSFESTPCT